MLLLLHIHFLYRRYKISFPYYCELLDKEKLTYWQRGLSFPIREVVVLHENVISNTALQIQKKTLPTVPICQSVIITCSFLWKRNLVDIDCVQLTGNPFSFFFFDDGMKNYMSVKKNRMQSGSHRKLARLRLPKLHNYCLGCL